tara:strand:+ start:292 stop:564 length:273 start_codon:yes stop_codon:yes gene_type:complete
MGEGLLMGTLTLNKEWIWKIFTVILGALVMPLAGWVWSMNERVIELEAGVANIEKKVSEAEENARALIGVEKDIEYMKSTLGRIEVLVTK